MFSAVILCRFGSEHLEKSFNLRIVHDIGYGFDGHGYTIHELKLIGLGLKQPFVILELKPHISMYFSHLPVICFYHN